MLDVVEDIRQKSSRGPESRLGPQISRNESGSQSYQGTSSTLDMNDVALAGAIRVRGEFIDQALTIDSFLQLLIRGAGKPRALHE